MNKIGVSSDHPLSFRESNGLWQPRHRSVSRSGPKVFERTWNVADVQRSTFRVSWMCKVVPMLPTPLNGRSAEVRLYRTKEYSRCIFEMVYRGPGRSRNVQGVGILLQCKDHGRRRRFLYRAKPRGGSDALAIGRACIDDIGQHRMTKTRRICAICTLMELFIISLASDRREGTNPSARENEGLNVMTVWKGESNSPQHGIMFRLMPSQSCARIIIISSHIERE